MGKGGTATLLNDGKVIAEGRIDKTSIGLVQALDEGLDVGLDTGTPVNEDYKVPFKFTGGLDRVTVTLH